MGFGVLVAVAVFFVGYLTIFLVASDGVTVGE
jgi:hypothetical protein